LALQANFGTVAMSVLTLYKAISGGIDWQDVSDPLMLQVSPLLGAVFALYTGFAVLVLLNLVTGVFVDSALKLSRADRERDLLQKIQRAFAASEMDSSGKVTWDEFETHLETNQMSEFFENLEISTALASELFHLIDQDGDGKLTFEELVVGGIMLQGPAKAMDLAMLCKSFETSMAGLTFQMTSLQRELAKMQSVTAQQA